MKQVKVDEVLSEIEFVKLAAKHFAENPETATFTEAEIVPGCFFAIRWGLGNDCVVVFRVDENSIPVNYVQVVEK